MLNLAAPHRSQLAAIGRRSARQVKGATRTTAATHSALTAQRWLPVLWAMIFVLVLAGLFLAVRYLQSIALGDVLITGNSAVALGDAGAREDELRSLIDADLAVSY